MVKGFGEITVFLAALDADLFVAVNFLYGDSDRPNQENKHTSHEQDPEQDVNANNHLLNYQNDLQIIGGLDNVILKHFIQDIDRRLDVTDDETFGLVVSLTKDKLSCGIYFVFRGGSRVSLFELDILDGSRNIGVVNIFTVSLHNKAHCIVFLVHQMNGFGNSVLEVVGHAFDVEFILERFQSVLSTFAVGFDEIVFVILLFASDDIRPNLFG